MTRAAAIQSSYVPWKGYFDIIDRVDEFVLYDDVQYSKNDWRNRNRIQTLDGPVWLTIPVRIGGRFGQLICDVEVADPRWATKHWRSLIASYGRARHFDELAPVVEGLYRRAGRERRLARINEILIRGICDLLEIDTRITSSLDYELPTGRVERLIALCERLGAGVYLTGPSAREYLDPGRFEAAGVEVEWMRYDGYAEYDQLHAPPFVHEVSILDLLFNEGAPGAREHLDRAQRRAPTSGET